MRDADYRDKYSTDENGQALQCEQWESICSPSTRSFCVAVICLVLLTATLCLFLTARDECFLFRVYWAGWMDFMLKNYLHFFFFFCKPKCSIMILEELPLLVCSLHTVLKQYCEILIIWIRQIKARFVNVSFIFIFYFLCYWFYK